MAARLKEKYIRSPNIFFNPYADFSIAKGGHRSLAQIGTNILADLLRQGGIRIPCKKFNVFGHWKWQKGRKWLNRLSFL